VDSQYHERVLGVAVLSNFAQLGTRLLLSPLVPAIIATFGVSKGAVGLALTGMWAGYALLQYPSGVLADRLGERPVVQAGLGLTAVTALLVALSPSFPWFAVSAAVLGLGTGLYFSVAAALLTRLYEQPARALSVHTAGGSLAGLVAPPAAGFVATRHGWRAALLLGAGAALVALTAITVIVRPTEPRVPDLDVVGRLVDVETVVDLLGRPTIAFTTGVAVVAAFAWQGVVSFLPTFLVEYWAVTTEQAGLAFGLVFLLSTGAQPAMGALSDAVSLDAVLATSFLLTAGGLGTLLLGSSPAVAVVGLGLLGLGISWPGVLQARFFAALGDRERGTGFGLVRTVFMLLGATGSVVTGVLADRAGWPVAFGLVVALLVVVVALLAANHAAGSRL